MSNREIVETFIAKRKKIALKFFVIQTVVDIATAVAIAVIMERALRNGKSIVPHILVLVLVTASTLMSQIRVYFGSFKNFIWHIKFSSGYDSPGHKYYTVKEALENAKDEYEKGRISDTKLAAAQKKFDETIDEIAERIKAQEK